MPNAVMGLRLKQQLTLTPRLQQSVKLLQLSALECVQELHQAIAQNPFLEEAAESPDTRTQAEEASESSHDDLDFSGGGSGGGGEDTPDWTEWTASPSTLHDSLHEQLLLLGLGERDYALANLVVDALDEDGFLRQPLEESSPARSRLHCASSRRSSRLASRRAASRNAWPCSCKRSSVGPRDASWPWRSSRTACP